MTIRVTNVRRVKDGEYIGRAMPGRAGSPLGNPYKIGPDGDREQVIYQYREWLEVQVYINNAVRSELRRLVDLARRRDVTLLCWCAPLPCHGDVVKEFIEQALSERPPKWFVNL